MSARTVVATDATSELSLTPRVIEKLEHEVRLGTSSRDLPLATSFRVGATGPVSVYSVGF